MNYNGCVPNKEVIQTVRTGRPTDDPKSTQITLRLSESDLLKLEFCKEKTGMLRAEIIRMGIDRVYQSFLNPEKDAKKEQ